MSVAKLMQLASGQFGDKVQWSFKRVRMPGDNAPIPSDHEMSRLLEASMEDPDLVFVSFVSLESTYLPMLGLHVLRLVPCTDPAHLMVHAFLSFVF